MAVIQMKWTDFRNPDGVKETFSVPGDITQADAVALCTETLGFYNSSRRNPNDAERTLISAEILPDNHPDAQNAYALNPETEEDPADEPVDESEEFEDDDSDLDDSEALFDDEDFEDEDDDGEDEW